MKKERIKTIAEKNRIIKAIIKRMITSDDFLLIGHKNPDEDCIASMIALSLLLSKFSKTASLYISKKINSHFEYLLNICKYNFINVYRAGDTIPFTPKTIAVLDTPKPSMLEISPQVSDFMNDPESVVIEIDHHLKADSSYIGDAGYCLVDEASSASELVGLLGFKLQKDAELMKSYQIEDLFSRNFVLSVLTGIIGDSKMGKYLKTNRERRFYRVFSMMFDELLASKTKESSGNFSTMEEVFTELERLSEKEDAFFNYMIRRKETLSPYIYSIVLTADDVPFIAENFSNDTVVTVARYTADMLAEESGYVSLIVYYEDPQNSPLIQFRMRRSQAFQGLDLREILDYFKLKNGGGHPGAIGFRIPRNEISSIQNYTKNLITGTEVLIQNILK